MSHLLKPTETGYVRAGIGSKVSNRHLHTNKYLNSKTLYCGGKVSIMSLCTVAGFLTVVATVPHICPLPKGTGGDNRPGLSVAREERGKK
jgi:hypothetical protein